MEMLDVLKDELRIVNDPRVQGRTRHKLIDILVLGILAVICHAETWEEMEDFGYARYEWLKKFLDLEEGVPSHDTIARVFSIIEPHELEFAFMSWVRRVQSENRHGKDTICIDGKSLHGTSESVVGQARKSLHVVNAFSSAQGLVLGQRKARGKGNAEVSAALELLDLLNIEKMILVGDAGIGKVSVVEKIVEKKADYIFPIKSNSRDYFDEIREAVEGASAQECETHRIEEEGHGRKETRTITLLRRAQFPQGLNKNGLGKDHFVNLQAIGKVVYEREKPETAPFTYKNGRREIAKDPVKQTTETRYFITSLKLSARGIMEKLRHQWSIENQLHWMLDVSLGEDANKTRNKVAAENLAVARKIALNLVKQDKSRRIGLKSRLKKAAWDLEYLETLLLQATF